MSFDRAWKDLSENTKISCRIDLHHDLFEDLCARMHESRASTYHTTTQFALKWKINTNIVFWRQERFNLCIFHIFEVEKIIFDICIVVRQRSKLQFCVCQKLLIWKILGVHSIVFTFFYEKRELHILLTRNITVNWEYLFYNIQISFSIETYLAIFFPNLEIKNIS